MKNKFFTLIALATLTPLLIVAMQERPNNFSNITAPSYTQDIQTDEEIRLVLTALKILENILQIVPSHDKKFAVAIEQEKENTLAYIISFKEIEITQGSLKLKSEPLKKYALAKISGKYEANSCKIECGSDSNKISLRVNNFSYSFSNYING